MPMNSLFLHCMWCDQKSRLSLTRACEFFSFSQGWTFAHACLVWTSGPVMDPYWLPCEPLLDLGSFVGFRGTLVRFWLDHCWTVMDSWATSSLSFQLELFVSLPCSEEFEWVVSMEISAGFIGSKFGWYRNWEKWKIHSVEVTLRANRW